MSKALPAPPEHRVVVLGTGGTISMRHEPAMGGAVPAIAPSEMIDALPPGLPAVRCEQFSRQPSSHLRLDALWMLRDTVSRLVSQPNVAGVVVTHGTDTLEESAYLLDITLRHDKPIVFTGAMRTASAVGYDGNANLAAAIRVAASPAMAGQGAVVVLNGDIHAARYVTKMHTDSLGAFQSPGRGPIERIDGDSITAHASVARGTLPWSGLEANVPLRKICVGWTVRRCQWPCQGAPVAL